MKNSLFASLLLCAALFAPVQVHAAGPHAQVPRHEQPLILVGGSVVEYLICLKNAHIAGASWDTAAGSCINPAARADTAQRSPGATAGGKARSR